MGYIDDLIRAAHQRVNCSKLGVIKRETQDSDVKWTISGDYGYQCIKDNNKQIEFRLYDSGKLVFLSDYNANVGAWGDYTKQVEIKDVDSLVKEPNWFERLMKCDKEDYSPNIIIV